MPHSGSVLIGFGFSIRTMIATTSSGVGEPAEFLCSHLLVLFGDGNPNANLEERRWQQIATVIRNSGGAVVAEQIALFR